MSGKFILQFCTCQVVISMFSCMFSGGFPAYPNESNFVFCAAGKRLNGAPSASLQQFSVDAGVVLSATIPDPLCVSVIVCTGGSALLCTVGGRLCFITHDGHWIVRPNLMSSNNSE